MDKFLTFTVLGLSQAAIYAIASSGLVVTYTTSGIFNFAHGAFGMMAAFTYWQVHVAWGVPTWPAFFLVVLVIAPLFGAGVERFIMRGIEGAQEVVKIVVTVSLMVALIFIALWIWPEDQARPIGSLVSTGEVRIAGVTLTGQRLLTIGVAVIVAIVLRFILRGTRLGIAMRAVVDDRSLLKLNGGRPGRTSMLSWALGASLAAVSGVLLASEQAPSVIPLTLLVVNAYAAAVVGRLKSIPGAFAGSIVLGLSISYVGAYLPADAAWGPIALDNLQRAVPAIMLFVVILAQPQVSLRAHSLQRTSKPAPVPTQRLALVGGLVLVAAVVGFGSLMSTPDQNTMLKGFGFAIATLSLVPLTGYSGQISLAQLTFTGIGAVVMANWGASGHFGWVLVAIAVCAAVGAVVALPAMRLQGIYLALATAAFAIFCYWMVFQQQDLMPGSTASVPYLRVGPIQVGSDFGQLVVLAIAFAVMANILVALRRSAWGRRLTAMRDSPVACATLGLNLMSTKVGVFALSAAIAGAGGALAGRTFVVDDFSLDQSLPITMLAVVGGIGSVGGALLGGLLLGIQPLATTALAANAIGVFGFFSASVTQVMSVMPGFMGISLGRNPDGAASQIGEAYRDFSRSGEAVAAAIGSSALLWMGARTELITNWGLFAALVVLVFAVMPVLPALLPPPGGARKGRVLPTSIWLLVLLVGTAVVPWEDSIGSTGFRLLAILAWSVIAAGATLGVLGADPSGRMTPSAPSPDDVGLGAELGPSEARAAAVALGVDEDTFTMPTGTALETLRAGGAGRSHAAVSSDREPAR
ncbi:MAG: ABC transporter permease [Microthrixaceae bacterium]|nr:ABC transporter permease [Microthrixaceae bacterium]